MSGKSTDSRRRPTQPSRPVSFEPITASQAPFAQYLTPLAANYSKKMQVLARQGPYSFCIRLLKTQFLGETVATGDLAACLVLAWSAEWGRSSLYKKPKDSVFPYVSQIFFRRLLVLGEGVVAAHWITA